MAATSFSSLMWTLCSTHRDDRLHQWWWRLRMDNRLPSVVWTNVLNVLYWVIGIDWDECLGLGVVLKKYRFGCGWMCDECGCVMDVWWMCVMCDGCVWMCDGCEWMWMDVCGMERCIDSTRVLGMFTTRSAARGVLCGCCVLPMCFSWALSLW